MEHIGCSPVNVEIGSDVIMYDVCFAGLSLLCEAIRVFQSFPSWIRIATVEKENLGFEVVGVVRGDLGFGVVGQHLYFDVAFFRLACHADRCDPA